MPQERIVIATRESPLALWQANMVKAKLERLYSGLEISLLGMTTKGDKILDSPLAKIGGKGLFVKELEQALIDGRADIAVHSMKDVPMAFPAGLCLSVMCKREEPRDALVSNCFTSLDLLPKKARVGTSSLRRQCQLRNARPDLTIVDLRGNVNTRLKKLDAGEYDAIILAAAGLIRLNLEERINQQLDPLVCLPAVGQGAMGIECRENDPVTISRIAALADAQTTLSVSAERSMNTCLNGGCQVPVAGHAVLNGAELTLKGLVGAIDGRRIIKAESSVSIRGSHEESVAAAHRLGEHVAGLLLEQGAGELLKLISES